MSIRVGLNGFGRIGRTIMRAAKKGNADIDFVLINDLTDPQTLATLLKYDSVHGRFPGEVSVSGQNLVIDGEEITVSSEKDPEKLPWKKLNVDVVIEATGVFRHREPLEKHLKAGAPQVVLTVPAKDKIDATIVLGVNDDILTGSEQIVSNASCTTNCAAPLAKVLHDAFGISHGYMSTIHGYTMGQNLLDFPHKDMRRARAAALSVIPTTTGAAKAIGKVIPELDGKLDGMAFRVPVPDGSIVDLAVNVEQSVTEADVHAAFKDAAEGALNGYLGYNEDPLVSADIIGDPRSSVYDAPLTKVIGGNFVKVSGWYDNEFGYSTRVMELAEKVVSLRK
ncbi:MAG TPA: type I glyceraldehyde-3-phosphate dehydrogenase [bacterium]|nr:type I glyceraldehyde-3-phosphate dehydrogenase [bacterium]